MDRRLVSAAALAFMAIVTLFTLTWGFRYDWPDFVHDRYGLPLTWGVHTLVTIQGPADTWIVDVTALFLDLVLWLGIMAASQILLQTILERRGG
jgi:Na+-transporting NADH:ubiquinone oxidoreductase subunit NqrE